MHKGLRTSWLGAFWLLALTATALAHAHLTSAIPAIGGSVAKAPTEIALHFSEALNLKFSGATLIGPNGTSIATGAARLKSGGGATLLVPISTALPAGTYKVEWHALSDDGHKSKGDYSFTVTP